MSIPYELDEAAYVDGASPLYVYWRIILLLSKPPLIVVGIFSFLGVWNDLLGPVIYLTNPDKFTVAVGLAQFRGMYSAQWHLLMAASTVVLLPVIVLFFIAQKYFIEGDYVDWDEGVLERRAKYTDLYQEHFRIR